MKTFFRISEATVIGLHACLLIGEGGGKPVSAAQIAATFRVSAAHAAKVLQRLQKAGLLKSVRGPAGGFTLNGNPRTLRLRRIFEALEGRFSPAQCLLGFNRCLRKNCIFGEFAHRAQREFTQLLELTLQQASLRSYGKKS